MISYKGVRVSADEQIINFLKMNISFWFKVPRYVLRFQRSIRSIIVEFFTEMKLFPLMFDSKSLFPKLFDSRTQGPWIKMRCSLDYSLIVPRPKFSNLARRSNNLVLNSGLIYKRLRQIFLDNPSKNLLKLFLELQKYDNIMHSFWIHLNSIFSKRL